MRCSRERLEPPTAQSKPQLKYMKLLDIALGLIADIHNSELTDGVSRLVLLDTNRE